MSMRVRGTNTGQRMPVVLGASIGKTSATHAKTHDIYTHKHTHARKTCTCSPQKPATRKVNALRRIVTVDAIAVAVNVVVFLPQSGSEPQRKRHAKKTAAMWNANTPGNIIYLWV